MNLFLVEVRRALHRRIVWWLLFLAIAGCVLTGIIAFVAAGNATAASSAEDSPWVMSQWWSADRGGGFITIAAIFLALGGAIAGASMAGAEWKAGNVTTVLTWEPRRGVLHAARNAAVLVSAFVIAVLLQALFLASAYPSVLTENGTTVGVDGDFWISLAGAIVRIAFFVAIIAVIAFNIATIGRNTSAALVAMGAWFIVLEPLVRSLRPKTARFVIPENVDRVVQWREIRDSSFERPPVVALITLLAYSAVIVAVALALFRRRDIAGA